MVGQLLSPRTDDDLLRSAPDAPGGVDISGDFMPQNAFPLRITFGQKQVRVLGEHFRHTFFPFDKIKGTEIVFVFRFLKGICIEVEVFRRLSFAAGARTDLGDIVSRLRTADDVSLHQELVVGSRRRSDADALFPGQTAQRRELLSGRHISFSDLPLQVVV